MKIASVICSKRCLYVLFSFYCYYFRTKLKAKRNCTTIHRYCTTIYRYCTTIYRYPIFSTKYFVMCKVYTGYYGTSEIEHVLCACTVDNPLAKARGLSLRTGAQTMLYLSHNVMKTKIHYLDYTTTSSTLMKKRRW